MHKRVSNTAEASCGGDCDCDFLELSGFVSLFPSLEEVEDERSVGDCWCWEAEGGEETCLETSKRSTRIYDTNQSALGTIGHPTHEPRESTSARGRSWKVYGSARHLG